MLKPYLVDGANQPINKYKFMLLLLFGNRNIVAFGLTLNIDCWTASGHLYTHLFTLLVSIFPATVCLLPFALPFATFIYFLALFTF